MDVINVPKKIHRHALKALSVLSDGIADKIIPFYTIMEMVEYQMRNLMPVRDLEAALKTSLRMLSAVGVIKNCGQDRYAIGHSYGATLPSPSSRAANSEKSRKRTYSTNNKPGDDLHPTHKRKRLNNKASLSSESNELGENIVKSKTTVAGNLNMTTHFTKEPVESNVTDQANVSIDVVLPTNKEETDDEQKILTCSKSKESLIAGSQVQHTSSGKLQSHIQEELQRNVEADTSSIHNQPDATNIVTNNQKEENILTCSKSTESSNPRSQVQNTSSGTLHSNIQEEPLRNVEADTSSIHNQPDARNIDTSNQKVPAIEPAFSEVDSNEESNKSKTSVAIESLYYLN
uniref:Uncharacterized protein n=1 Tax=Stomoxys calcitrans TaxID=35570 RepID=A0A1I8Q541_STOCA